ncbi:MAG: 2-oxoacid:ferredoxin oxidoreductase subunit beta [Candidatus Cloacimonetes bacterium]|nr:2-oxoacid:ferredoxin oxidoreductase subunit beta [Candidatus Cloacimonadota bacterium]
MSGVSQKVVHQYLRHNKKFPNVWCAGCSIGIVLGSVIRAIAELQIPKDDIMMVSGIGCSSRMPVYVDFNSLHTLHGRPIPFATGIKLFKPHMKVIVITGDGDATAIGGNHFIHGARRNIDMTVIVINNNIYGMTGGQYSPTTPSGDIATTCPHGNIDPPFDICQLAIGAGASFVARTTAFHSLETQNLVKDAINHSGYSVLEVLSACPVIYGRLNKKGNASRMMEHMRDNSISIKAVDKLPAEKVENKVIRGILKQDTNMPEFTARYTQLVESLREKADKEA